MLAGACREIRPATVRLQAPTQRARHFRTVSNCFAAGKSSAAHPQAATQRRLRTNFARAQALADAAKQRLPISVLPSWFILGELPASEDSGMSPRSEEHTSELQSLRHLVCRLLLEKKK